MIHTTIQTPAKIIPHAFPGIGPEEVQDIIANSRIKSYPAGTVICRENSIENSFYMILEGRFEVTKTISNVQARHLKTLYPGDFFGEMALIHKAPRAATVSAISDGTLLELDENGFEQVLKRSSSVAMAMVSEISNRLRQNDEMAIEDLRLRAAELADAYKKLAEQELARREFLTNIAHELRTPLMIASGYLQAVRSGMVPSEHVEASVETISRNVDQIVTLTNDILFLQEMDLVLPEFQKVELPRIVKLVIEKLHPKAASRQITITHIHDELVPPVRGDMKSLERAIAAVLDNAVKFSKPGGEVELRYTEENSTVSLIIQDHGIGIAQDILPRIYDRFFHLERIGDDLYGGVGIGLSIARQVILQHKGTINAESKPGLGSRFTITLNR